VGLRELLCDPQDHSDFLLGFVEKRIDLTRLPGAPVPPWQQITDRADKFRAYRERHDEQAVGSSKGLEARQRLQIQRPVTTKATEMARIKSRSNARILVSDEALIEAMAQILHGAGGRKLSEAIVEQARFQIQRDLDQYRRPTAARTLNGLVKELRPSDYSTFLPDLINEYVEWLLGLMLALGREPSFNTRQWELLYFVPVNWKELDLMSSKVKRYLNRSIRVPFHSRSVRPFVI
jgi:hypothetical protein